MPRGHRRTGMARITPRDAVMDRVEQLEAQVAEQRLHIERQDQEMAALRSQLQGSEIGANGRLDGGGTSGTKGSRRDLLKMSGAAVAGAAGLALTRSMPAAAINGDNLVIGNNNSTGNVATSETHLVANPGGSYSNGAALYVETSGTGVDAIFGFGSGAGSGLEGEGGSTAGPGVRGSGGTGSGPGVRGIGGSTNGLGVSAQGTGTGAGVTATGGATGGSGVIANGGSGSGIGLEAVGGAPNGDGIVGAASGIG